MTYSGSLTPVVSTSLVPPTRGQQEGIAPMPERPLSVPIVVWIAFFAAATLFLAAPEIDLIVSRLFYTPGVGFTFRGSPIERFLYHSVEWLSLWGGLALIGTSLYAMVARRPAAGLSARDLTIALLILALGPGLLVNGVLKESYGRARPAQIVEFDGERTFTPAFVPSDQGGRSFSSGHASAAFFWTSVALLAKRRRQLWISAAVAYGLLIGFVRIAAGGHFLSDVVASFFIVLILTFMLRDFVYRYAGPVPVVSQARISARSYLPVDSTGS